MEIARRDYRGVLSRGHYSFVIRFSKGLVRVGARVKASLTARKELLDELERVKQHLASVPSSDRWLNDNSVAKASVDRGLQQSAAGCAT
jgi:flavin-dependent dehydrogenase